jgi:uncharacterized protein YdbL (DUF1318 family)
LTYSITGGDDASSFSIDGSSGVITFNSAPDYETKTSYLVTVSVTDGINTITQALNIAVTNVGEIWAQLGSDIDGEAADDFNGYSVSVSSDGTTVAIGAPQNDGNGDRAGHVRIYKWDGSNWLQRGLDIDGAVADDLSGYSVSISSDGETVAIGVNQSDANGLDSGHVRIYKWDGSNWVKLGLDIEGEAADNFSGFNLSLSSDGETVAIGTPFNDDAGLVRIYNWGGSNWQQLGSDIEGEAADDRSGFSVSLSGDGSTVAIGDPFNKANGIDSGHVRIYKWDGSEWVQRGSDIEGGAADNYSGYSVSISSDGETVAIGAPLNDGNGLDSGHVRIYNWDGSNWQQLGSDIEGETAEDRSGDSVSLSSDGETVAISAPRKNDSAGQVRIYNWDGTTWQQLGSGIDGEAVGDFSGFSVSLSNDGATVAIGAPINDGNGLDSGHVRVFEWK